MLEPVFQVFGARFSTGLEVARPTLLHVVTCPLAPRTGSYDTRIASKRPVHASPPKYWRTRTPCTQKLDERPVEFHHPSCHATNGECSHDERGETSEGPALSKRYRGTPLNFAGG